MSQISQISDDTFDSEVLKTSLPVVVDFWAEWCGPCKAIAPKLEELSKTYSGQVKIVKLNVDENQQTPSTLGIRGIPTLILFKGGQPVDKLVGNHPSETIEAFIQRAIKS